MILRLTAFLVIFSLSKSLSPVIGWTLYKCPYGDKDCTTTAPTSEILTESADCLRSIDTTLFKNGRFGLDTHKYFISINAGTTFDATK